ncbi:MAG: cyclase family protein [Sinobacteraceae bacterium]|nr:cyclase family protein [Nevskiaceae bacterium]
MALPGCEVLIDLAQPVVLAIEQHFAGEQPRHFDAPAASSQPYAMPGFSGAVRSGASCNCSVITLIPHCNGTHTECVGHLTAEALAAQAVIPFGLIPAVLLSVPSLEATSTSESTTPKPQEGDRLITRRALQAAWPAALPFTPRAAIIRTLPNGQDKLTRDYSAETPPYLSREAAEWLVSVGIEHLVVDVPSLDRSHDEGRLTGHRVFFGLPPGSQQLAAARRPQATVTELAFVPDAISDGPCLLELQSPALAGDAVPSRPLLYRLCSA